MNERKILYITFAVCLTLLIVCALLIAANKKYLSEPYNPEWALQESDVPTGLVNHVRSTYPSVAGIDWEMDGGRYEASFILAGRKVEFYFDQDLKWTKTEHSEAFDALPESVQRYVIQEAGNEFEINTVERVQTPDSQVAWEVELATRIYEWIYQFDEHGQFLNKRRELKIVAESPE